MHRLADRNWRKGDGGPFAAVVAEQVGWPSGRPAAGTSVARACRPGEGPELEEITTFDEGRGIKVMNVVVSVPPRRGALLTRAVAQADTAEQRAPHPLPTARAARP